MTATPKFSVKILTLFPEMFPGCLDYSVTGRSRGELWDLEAINIRDYATDKHHTVDDRPAGGGNGMVIKPDVLARAIEDNGLHMKKYMLSPRGCVFNQKKASEILAHGSSMFICGRYEGVDQRVLDYYDIEEISIGDYVLSGGEIAVQVIIDCCLRLIPGVLGGKEVHDEESFLGEKFENLLEYPHYTKPNKWKGMEIPEILLSGDHKKVDLWRLEQAKNLTKTRRKDLWERYLNKLND